MVVALLILCCMLLELLCIVLTILICPVLKLWLVSKAEISPFCPTFIISPLKTKLGTFLFKISLKVDFGTLCNQSSN